MRTARWELARTQRFDMIFSDVVMPGKDGLTLLGELKSAGIQTPVVMVSGQANIEMAVRATRLGAVDFLEKPLSTEKLLVTGKNTVKLSRLEQENRRLKKQAGKQELVWKSVVMQTVMAKIERVAASETRVCIWAKQVPARSWWRTRCMTRARVTPVRSSH